MGDEDDLDWQRLGLAIAACALIVALILATFFITGPPVDPHMKGETSGPHAYAGE